MAVYDTPDRAILTPASPIVATNLALAPPGAKTTLMLMSISNGNVAAQTSTVTLFDEAAPLGALANQIFSGVLGPGQVIAFGVNGIPLHNGLTSVLSVAPAANVVIVWAYRVR